MEELCPQCGSLDVIPDYRDESMLICLDCGFEFPSKIIHKKNLECPEDQQNPYDPNEWNEDKEDEEDELLFGNII